MHYAKPPLDYFFIHARYISPRGLPRLYKTLKTMYRFYITLKLPLVTDARNDCVIRMPSGDLDGDEGRDAGTMRCAQPSHHKV